MRILISGSREFENYHLFKKSMINILSEIQYKKELRIKDFEIIHGGASGVDKMGDKFANEFKLSKKVYLVDWQDMTPPVYFKQNEQYGEYNARAGFNRNIKMFDYASRGDGILIAFWMNNSPGTKQMIDTAKKGKMPSYIHIIKMGMIDKVEKYFV